MQASNTLARIADAMAPYIGRMMAQSSIDMHCKKLGIVPETSIEPRQLDELLNRLALGLNIFIGRDKTTALVTEIRGGLVQR